MNRIIIFTGKGGVGKSSVTCAHGMKAAEMGLKTLIVSTDMAHNISDIFQIDVGKKEKEVAKNLWALEIDVNYEMENRFSEIGPSIKKLIKFQNEMDEDTFEDIMIFPGMEEVISLIKIKEIFDKEFYDLILIDCAPTGETFSMLKFPELLGWYMEKILPVGKVALKVLRPVSKRAFKLELPSDVAINDIERIYVKLFELQKLLKNRELCSIRLVTIPEKMIIEETKRSYMYLNLYGFNVDGVYINRVISEDVKNEFFNKWKEIQKNYMEEIYSVFSLIPIYKIKWYEKEVEGAENIKIMGDSFIENTEIFSVKTDIFREKFVKENDKYILEVPIPLGKKDNFKVFKGGTDIIISIENFKRNVPLPNSLLTYDVCKAKFDNDILKITFQEG